MRSRSQNSLSAQPYRVETSDDGQNWAEYFADNDHYILRFPGVADFSHDLGSQVVHCWPEIGADEESVSHLYSNHVVPRVLGMVGHLVLHASSVEIGKAGALFLGQSGAGKSTLATSLALQGHRMISEDCAVLSNHSDTLYVEPSQPSIRLWRDSCDALFVGKSDQFRVRGSDAKTCISNPPDVRFMDTALPVGIVFHLLSAGDNEIKLTKYSARDALADSLKHMFLLDDRRPLVMTTHLDKLVEFSNSISHYELRYPRRFRCLRRVRAKILECCAT